MNTWWKKNKIRFHMLVIKHVLHRDKLTEQEFSEMRTLQQRHRKYQRNIHKLTK